MKSVVNDSSPPLEPSGITTATASDLAGSDEDVLDQCPQDALAVLGGGGGGVVAEPGEEAFEVAGEPEVGVAVGGPGVQRVELGFQACCASTAAGSFAGAA